MKSQSLALIPLSFFTLISPSFALSLKDYLRQVEEKNGSIQASKNSSEAKELRFDEGSAFFKPSFFLNGEYYDDQRPTNAPAFQGFQTIRHTLRAGVSQNLRLGTRTSFSYNYFKTHINGASPTLLPTRRFFDLAPTLEFSQSLWRNFLGSEFKAQETILNSQIEAGKFNDQFQYKLILLQAENAYWRLFFAQTSLKVQKESLERARRLKEWNEQRVKNNLVDETELLQAESNLQAREIEFQDNLTEIEIALREFNSMRESVDEDVELVGTGKDNSHDILNTPVPKKTDLREDVKAFMASQKVAEASSKLGIEKTKPNLEFYASYSLNGRDGQSYQAAQDMAFSGTRPFSIVGIRLTTPIDFYTMRNYRKSYAQEVAASEMQLKRKLFEVEREWEILNSKFKNFKERLRLAKRLEKLQERKLSQEKTRYRQGRTTTFQVLQFEQDFANSQLLKLRYERELILIHNQLKLFSGANL